MKEQETKKSKRKIALYYLILAACLLVIAAVTVTVVLTTRKPNNQLSDNHQNQTVDKNDDKNNDNSDDDKKPSDGNNGGNSGDNNDDNNDENPKPTETDGSYAMPTLQASVAQSYEFVYDKTLDRYCVHKGMDFAGKAGDKVYAVLDGTVKEIVLGSVLDGNYITLEHADGITSTYKFIDVKEGLKQGATVKRGDEIGSIAAASGTEMNQGDHLHFEMTEKGKIADPTKYLKLTEK